MISAMIVTIWENATAIGFVLLSASCMLAFEKWLAIFGGWHLRRSGRQTDASVSSSRKLRSTVLME